MSSHNTAAGKTKVHSRKIHSRKIHSRKHSRKVQAPYERDSAFVDWAKTIWDAERTILDAERTSMLSTIIPVSDPSRVAYDRAFLKGLVCAIKNAEARNKHPATDGNVCDHKVDRRYIDLIRGGYIYQGDISDFNIVLDAIVLQHQ